LCIVCSLCTPPCVLQPSFFKHLIVSPSISGLWAAGAFGSSNGVCMMQPRSQAPLPARAPSQQHPIFLRASELTSKTFFLSFALRPRCTQCFCFLSFAPGDPGPWGSDCRLSQQPCPLLSLRPVSTILRLTYDSTHQARIQHPHTHAHAHMQPLCSLQLCSALYDTSEPVPMIHTTVSN